MRKSISFFVAVLLGMSLFITSCGVPDDNVERDVRDSLRNLKMINVAVERLIDCTRIKSFETDLPDDLVDRMNKDSVTIAKMQEELAGLKAEINSMKSKQGRVK
ncbi:MAG: hypothetical protein ACOYOV_14775 [Bacteroidales bacterium]